MLSVAALPAPFNTTTIAHDHYCSSHWHCNPASWLVLHSIVNIDTVIVRVGLESIAAHCHCCLVLVIDWYLVYSIVLVALAVIVVSALLTRIIAKALQMLARFGRTVPVLLRLMMSNPTPTPCRTRIGITYHSTISSSSSSEPVAHHRRHRNSTDRTHSTQVPNATLQSRAMAETHDNRGKSEHEIEREQYQYRQTLPIKYVIGLGNPGSKFVATKHNIGFDVIDQLITEFDFTAKVNGMRYTHACHQSMQLHVVGVVGFLCTQLSTVNCHTDSVCSHTHQTIKSGMATSLVSASGL
jgi:hypothetical protein